MENDCRRIFLSSSASVGAVCAFKYCFFKQLWPRRGNPHSLQRFFQPPSCLSFSPSCRRLQRQRHSCLPRVPKRRATSVHIGFPVVLTHVFTRYLKSSSSSKDHIFFTLKKKYLFYFFGGLAIFLESRRRPLAAPAKPFCRSYWEKLASVKLWQNISTASYFFFEGKKKV